MKYEEARIRSDILRALGHPVRVLIVDALAAGDCGTDELIALTGIDQSGLSRHLAVLRRAGMVQDRREGMKICYHLATPCILKVFECAVEVVRTETKRKDRLLKA